ncbi:MAG: aldolase/citrate lyase family protein [Paracoccaceae bacterium]|nr:aldolase/citrate lyase family protein [Paracoccaceae bacterium]MDG2258381.1 aldolase/citrate lyase family protein [Paracoccaceae bacterium]
MFEKSLNKRLKNREAVVGSWITLAHPTIAEIMANSGFDWLAVDLEHSVITIREAEELMRIIELSGVAPMVRLTSNDPDQIKRVMDAGSHGVIVPMINTREDAEKAVAAVKYPSVGKRGFGLARAQRWGNRFAEYLEWQKENTTVIVQIEHIDAVTNIEEILSVDGVDGFFVGPYDLSGSMGIPGQFDDADFLEAIETVKKAGAARDIPSGIHIIEPDDQQLVDRIQDGYQFVAYSLDVRMLDVSCRTGLKAIQREKT